MLHIIPVRFAYSYQLHAYILFLDPVRGQERATSLPQSYGGPKINIYAPSLNPTPSPGARQRASGYTNVHDIYRNEEARFQAMAYAASGETITFELAVGFFEKGKAIYLKVSNCLSSNRSHTNSVLFRSSRTFFGTIPRMTLFCNLSQNSARRPFSSSKPGSTNLPATKTFHVPSTLVRFVSRIVLTVSQALLEAILMGIKIRPSWVTFDNMA